MSRIGKLPVVVPAGVEVKIGEGNLLTVKGPKGTLEKKIIRRHEHRNGRRSDRSYKTQRSEEA